LSICTRKREETNAAAMQAQMKKAKRNLGFFLVKDILAIAFCDVTRIRKRVL
jgi:hypothetical protein